jgi:hypothetical protein
MEDNQNHIKIKLTKPCTKRKLQEDIDEKDVVTSFLF